MGLSAESKRIWVKRIRQSQEIIRLIRWIKKAISNGEWLQETNLKRNQKFKFSV